MAATLPADTSESEFWNLYGSAVRPLAGLRVHDPFMGGGSTLIEAARLGASVSGTDVDATAQLIVSHSLRPASADAVGEAGRELLAFLRSHFGKLYPNNDGEPLHWFWLPIVRCPSCKVTGALYRTCLLVRDCKKPGAVVRDHGMTVFDPETMALHHLKSAAGETFAAADGRQVRIGAGTFQSRKYQCPSCGARSSHRELATGAAPQRLIAIERTPSGGRRKLVSPSQADLAAIDAATEMLQKPPVPIRIPTIEFDAERTDPRPRSYGIKEVRDLFTPRQLLVLGAAHAWLDTANLEAPVDRAVRLALSNSLMTNNRLCSYATDYGRLAALFSVRAYSFPAISVELNPLHSNGGRGTLRQCLHRVARSASLNVRRSTWDVASATAVTTTFDFAEAESVGDLGRASAADYPIQPGVDVVIFDPPYYDYINYDELAELFRAWNPDLTLGGQPLQSSIGSDADSFGVALADCLRPAIEARTPRYPMAFTYHSSNPAAWNAVGLALDEAKLRITALWPVRSDSYMGHHSHPGNCEWDTIVVCRPIEETTSAKLPSAVTLWERHLGELPVSAADYRSFEAATAIASPRFGNVMT